MAQSFAERVEKSSEAYRSIGEASESLGLRPHVLRYWESRFPKIVSPLKRRDGRRMFRPCDLDGLKAIQILVHERELTLKSAAKVLETHGVEAVLRGGGRLFEAAESKQNGPVGSPALDLQASVRQAFSGASAPDNGDHARSDDTGLQLTLAGLSDLKARLDQARARRVA